MLRSFALMALASFSLFANPLCAPGRSEGTPSSTSSGQPPAKDPCSDLVADFKSCAEPVDHSPCGTPKEYINACLVGCMVEQCPKIADCPKVLAFNKGMLSNVPCTDCADLHDATFWENGFNFSKACADLTFDPNSGSSVEPSPEERKQYAQCMQMTMESKCPGLVGTGWAEKIPGVLSE